MTLLLVLNIVNTILIIVITAAIIYIKREIPCKWSVHGCKQRRRRSVLPLHQDSCGFRTIYCPSIHRGTCLWSGSAANLLRHSQEKPCIQVLRVENPTQPFESFVGDYLQPELTVFNQARYIYWRPILLLGHGISEYLVYITVHRTPAGMWYITPRSYSPQGILDYMTIKIEVFKHETGAVSRKPLVCFYQGGIASNQLSNQEAQADGKVMILGDGLVKSLQTQNRLFAYKIKVTTVVP